jgi:hypothetical protein
VGFGSPSLWEGDMDGISRQEIESSLSNLLIQHAKLSGAIEILQNQLKALDAKQEKDK